MLWYSYVMTEALLMSTYNICSHGEIRKIVHGHSLLFGVVYICMSIDILIFSGQNVTWVFN